MITPKLLRRLSLIFGVSFLIINNPVAQASFVSHLFSSDLIAQTPFPRLRFKLPSRGAPVKTIGGATRTGVNVTPLLPPTKLLGLTASDSPTIFIYISPNNQFDTANLIIEDEKKEEVYNGILTFVPTEGVLRVKIPQEVNLIAGQTYKWSFNLVDDQDRNTPKAKRLAEGWLEKVPLNDNLKKIDDENIETWTAINILAEEGIWQDTLEKLAMLQVANPEDPRIKQQWRNLLVSVGIQEYIANSQIIPGQIIPDVVEVEVK